MKRIESKQKGVRFIYCPNDATIDKRKDWGESEDNHQKSKHGHCFFKIDENGEISHMVQSNVNLKVPTGWTFGDESGTYDKSPIYLGQELNKGEVKILKTLDGEITYEIKEKSFVCHNETVEDTPETRGRRIPSEVDVWVQTEREIKKNYHYE